MTKSRSRFIPGPGFECWVSWSAAPGTLRLADGRRVDVKTGDQVLARHIDDETIEIVEIAPGGLN